MPTNQVLNPAGTRQELGTRAYDLAASPAGDLIAVLTAQGVSLFGADGSPVRKFRRGTASMAGIAFSPDGLSVAASLFEPDGDGVTILDVAGVRPATRITLPAGSIPAGLVYSPAGDSLFVALSGRNALVEIDIATGAVRRSVATGVAPLGVALLRDRHLIFVSNEGGKQPAAGDATSLSDGAKVLVDARGVARSGTVSAIDATTFQVVAEIATGLHPAGLAADPASGLVAVANANSDSVTLIDARSLRVADTLAMPSFPSGYAGSSPNAVAFSANGNRLYVACGGINAVAVFERQVAGRGAGALPARTLPGYRRVGVLPADWFPVALTALPQADGSDMVFVANSKGVGRNQAAVAPFGVGQRSGTLNRIHWTPGSATGDASVAGQNEPFTGSSNPADSPSDLGSLGIRHVFLIIKENRTYDQVLGDLPIGNGSRALTLFGADVTPNQHALAQQFALLDNFFVSGEVSADGHQWLTQAMASGYIERSSGQWARSYPFTGDDPLAFASTGFIWNQVQAQGLSVAIFGEFAAAAAIYKASWADYLNDADAPVRQIAAPSKGSFASLQPLIETEYPAFNLGIPDQFRARILKDRLRQWEAAGAVPNLVIAHLPNDHTQGTAPGAPAPQAMVADNDLAVGRIVEEISNSSYWSSSVIFITEDDAQDGVDHVDGHRSFCLVVSPYARRNTVVSTAYNQTSILRSIEEILGLPPINKFAAAALPMRQVFVSVPDFTPVPAVPARTSLVRMNAPVAVLRGQERRDARASRAMDFSSPDAAPEDKLNRIIWRSVKGFRAKYPQTGRISGKRKDDDDE